MRKLLLITLVLLTVAVPSIAAKTWTGVDESVVEHFAEQANRPAHEPLINTDKGDLLLFVFLVAGAAGGFVGGYYYRELFGKRHIEQEK